VSKKKKKKKNFFLFFFFITKKKKQRKYDLLLDDDRFLLSEIGLTRRHRRGAYQNILTTMIFFTYIFYFGWFLYPFKGF
jgi:hypothetical protein